MNNDEWMWTCPSCHFYGELDIYARCPKCLAPHMDLWSQDPVYGMISYRLTDEDMRQYRNGTVTQKELMDRVGKQYGGKAD